jgi:hypothetical protein
LESVHGDDSYLLKRAGRKSKGITNAQQICLQSITEPLRLVAYTYQETGQEYPHHQSVPDS